VAWRRDRRTIAAGAIVVVGFVGLALNHGYPAAKVVTLGQASAAMEECLHAQGAHMARTAQTGRWQARFTDGRTGKFYFAGSTTDSGAFLIASFDPASQVIGIRPRVPRGGDAHLLATCAHTADIGVVPF
jgi:hypothetical protein